MHGEDHARKEIAAPAPAIHNVVSSKTGIARGEATKNVVPTNKPEEMTFESIAEKNLRRRNLTTAVDL